MRVRPTFFWLPAVLAAATLASMACAAELDIYGKLNVTLQDSDDGTSDQVELRNNASRVGVKGEKALGGDLKAIYQLEFGVNIDGDSGDDVFTHRNQFVGVEGAFGTIKVGRHDTALKAAQGDFDLFNDLEGDIGRVLNGENRLRDYIGYTTPKLGKALSATLNFFPGEDADSGNDGVADRTSVSAAYETDTVYAAVAHDRDVDGEGIATTRVVGGHTFGPARLMLLYQRTDASDADEDGFGASLAWTLGEYTAKFQYLAADIWRTDAQADPLENFVEDMVSVGVDRALGDDTTLFVFYTAGQIGGANEDVRYAAFGIEHDF
jgi:predicted porin